MVIVVVRAAATSQVVVISTSKEKKNILSIGFCELDSIHEEFGHSRRVFVEDDSQPNVQKTGRHHLTEISRPKFWISGNIPNSMEDNFKIVLVWFSIENFERTYQALTHMRVLRAII